MTTFDAMSCMISVFYYGFPALLSIGTGLYLYRANRKPKSKEGLVIYTKYPVPGLAKTRLIPAIGEEGAAQTQRVMTEGLVRKMVKYQDINPGVSITVSYYGCSDYEMYQWFGRLQKQYPRLRWTPQVTTGDLGHKMASTFKDQFQQNRDSAVIIGCDIPGINESIVEDAMSKLRNRTSKMVLGPAEDGGYYLVGLRKETRDKLDLLFSGKSIDWSTESVLAQQTEAASKLNISCHHLDKELSDVDTKNDLNVVSKEYDVSADQLKQPKWSIAVPVLNESTNVEGVFNSILKATSNTNKLEEIIFCDGGSTDNTLAILERLSQSSTVPIRIISCKKGRGTQLKTGLEHAKGFYLLALHVDSLLPKDYDIAAEELLKKPGTVAGCFRLGFDAIDIPEKRQEKSLYFRTFMSLVKWGVSWRVKKFELPFGDQGLFLTRVDYQATGGYPDWPLFEDVGIVKELRKFGRVQMLDEYTMITSSRRWENNGCLKTTALTNLYLWAFNFGVSPETLASWYYGRRK